MSDIFSKIFLCHKTRWKNISLTKHWAELHNASRYSAAILYYTVFYVYYCALDCSIPFLKIALHYVSKHQRYATYPCFVVTVRFKTGKIFLRVLILIIIFFRRNKMGMVNITVLNLLSCQLFSTGKSLPKSKQLKA
jgi:hypothetical protein